ncbi:Hint domain-containing protein [uncultured Litoreibacter sp.]|uniref:Hint domain-containing protein n=1 Tax=uncultured Litoreibacter sp. TaxID=1392394 RepID=UPI0026254F11|nr:Hint domain-containing protein [uncultured Litoreibacter sp.]
MPLFDFDTGTGVTSNSTSLTFTDNTVTFVASTSGVGGSNNISYAPQVGELTFSDNAGLDVFTLDVAAGPANTNFAQTAGGNLQVAIDTISGTWNVTLVGADGAANVVLSASTTGQVLNFTGTAGSNYSEIRFTPTGAGQFIAIDSLTAEITCYLEGTGIATPDGDVAVEDLQPGDVIMTADGGTTEVKWVGIQPVDTRKATPSKVNPICLVKGAIADNVPARDLFVSPDHAIEIDGLLFNAHALVNGRSIFQARNMPLDGFTYYHIDTGAHEVIMAENCPSESYLDAVGRENFVNGDERADAPIIPEMALPRIAAKRMVPQPLAAALEARADALGIEAPRAVRAA